MALDYSKQKTLINIELTQGKELANQLKSYLVDHDTEKSGDTCELLLEKILSCYEKSIAMLKSSAIKCQEQKETRQCFSDDSPRSYISDQSQLKIQKKRKALPEWSKTAQVSTRAGLDDGYSWRKYGQKDILGATFPRAYYRCTHRHTQGCLATKQVQQSDEDQSIFHITCKGRHTCNQTTQSCSMPGKESKKQKKVECTKEARTEDEIKDMSFNCETTNLKTDKLEAVLEKFPSFSFPSTSTEKTSSENYLFSSALWENDSPTYISQDASESDYFSLSPCHMNGFEASQYLQHSESNNMEMLSAPSSVTNSPTEDLHISLDQVKFDPDFPFDLVEYFH
ncbi:WRKY domain-containing protein [Heracleum sosnowskyi]|uniref:WRKY domain-containing protein n=1 Tax=Heracleum sosnowskyi TaxID=360622 RepID=A0AAD8MLU9_9APIA|nr:WRKY domain-containing protein [Heracleum sosnowskyi]